MVSINDNVASDGRRRTLAAARWSLASALAAAVIAIAPLRAAPAATPGDLPSLQVRYGDLDLSTDRGAQTLLHRIAAAAERVCPRADGADLGAFALSRSCRRQAIARAVQEVGSSRLAALTEKRLGHGVARHG